MTTPWITNRPPSYRDADSKQNVLVLTSIDWHPYHFAVMHWSLAAQGYLPWRHTSRWVDHEPPAPVIVTPEQEPEAAAPEIGNWITHRLPTEADADKDGDVKICTSPGIPTEDWCYEQWWRVTLDTPWRHTAPWWFGVKPTPAAPEPEPEKVTRGFARIDWVLENREQVAIATDGTAWRRFVVCGDWEKWEQIDPLPQPGEE